MFVLQSKYKLLFQEHDDLLQKITDLKLKNKNLELQNDELSEQVDNPLNNPDVKFEHMLLKCAIECISHVEGVRETVLSSYQAIEDESESSDKIHGLLDVSSNSLKHIVTEMKDLTHKMGGMTDNITGLSEMAGSINSFVSTISKISDQTNLLALNAAIEAARAGEAGRGFSVVADEVRSLANNTNRSANEVAELVNSIIKSTSETADSVSDIQKSNSQLSGGVEKLNDHYASIITCCSSMKEAITHTSLRTFIQTVKLDHIVWKGDVYAVASGVSQKPIEDFSNHTMCRLGKWYQNIGAENYGNIPAFKKLNEPHKKVHRNGVEALTLMLSGNKEESIKYLLAMEDASQIVMQYLDEISSQS
ncbi:chemotaxis protein [Psychromonas sp. PRT-SC03]|nr:chemotaxis protein [Psychromonas sp. PRT-SC03]